MGDPAFSWNLVADVRDMWSYPFMVNAFQAGTVAAVVGAAVGWFTVLRRQTFAAHTLSAVAFPGAALATLAGFSMTLGYFGSCVAGALVLAALPRGRETGGEEAAATGVVQAFLLGCGFLFVSLYKGLLQGPQAFLFGTFLGITTAQVRALAIVGTVVMTALGVLWRPLLFASVDPLVASARGIRVRALSVAFLVLLAAAAAETAQITGALLVFSLMVLPAATARALTARPAYGLLLSVGVGLCVLWAGLFAAWYWPCPLGFFVSSFAFGVLLVAQGYRMAADSFRRGRRPFARHLRTGAT